MVKPVVRISFDFPRGDYAVLKALCIERGISIKQLATDSLMEIKEKWSAEDMKEDEINKYKDYKQIEIA